MNLVGRFKGSVKLDGELVLGGEIILFFVSLWFFIFLMMLFCGELMQEEFKFGFVFDN